MFTESSVHGEHTSVRMKWLPKQEDSIVILVCKYEWHNYKQRVQMDLVWFTVFTHDYFPSKTLNLNVYNSNKPTAEEKKTDGVNLWETRVLLPVESVEEE